ncbi:MAG: TolC family protein [Proteobacteria bacterium]|nr:TolC family protein [Pseudomonadota bacterium]
MVRSVASIVLTVSLALCFGASAQDGAPVLTLEEAIALALIDNPSVVNADLDIDKSGTDIDAAQADYFPELKATVKSVSNLITQNYTFEQGAFGTFPATGPIPANDTDIGTSSSLSTTVGLTVTQSLSGIYAVMLEVEALSI